LPQAALLQCRILHAIKPLTFGFNFADAPVQAPVADGAQYVIGGAEIPAFGVSVWRG
jgi:hypothetical protein